MEAEADDLVVSAAVFVVVVVVVVVVVSGAGVACARCAACRCLGGRASRATSAATAACAATSRATSKSSRCAPTRPSTSWTCESTPSCLCPERERERETLLLHRFFFVAENSFKTRAPNADSAATEHPTESCAQRRSK